MKFYKNGSVMSSSGSPGGSLPNINIYLGVVRFNSSNYAASKRTISMASIGLSMDDATSALFAADVATLNYLLGR